MFLPFPARADLPAGQAAANVDDGCRRGRLHALVVTVERLLGRLAVDPRHRVGVARGVRVERLLGLGLIDGLPEILVEMGGGRLDRPRTAGQTCRQRGEDEGREVCFHRCSPVQRVSKPLAGWGCGAPAAGWSLPGLAAGWSPLAAA